MEKQEYKTKSGKTRYKPVMTAQEYSALRDDNGGWCLACGEEAYGVEPDARCYQCESCNSRTVYGIEELLLMNLVAIKE